MEVAEKQKLLCGSKAFHEPLKVEDGWMAGLTRLCPLSVQVDAGHGAAIIACT